MVASCLRAASLAAILAFLFMFPARGEERPQVLKGARKAVLAGAFSPDGRRVAVANAKRLWVLDSQSGREVAQFFEVEKIVRHKHDYEYDWDYRYGAGNGLVFLDEGRVATTGMGAMVTVWDAVDQGKPEALDWPATDGYPMSLAWAPGRGVLAAGTGSGAVVLLRPGEATAPVRLQGPPQAHYALAFSGDERYLGAAGNGSVLTVWDLDVVGAPVTFTLEQEVNDLAALPEAGRVLVAGRELQVWDFLAGREASRFESPGMAGQGIGMALGALTLVVAADVLVAAAAAPYGAISSSSAADAATLGILLAPVPATVEQACRRAAAVSPDGRFIADMHPGLVKERIRIIDPATGTVIEELNPRGGATCDLQFSPDGHWLLVANSKGAHLYDTRSWKARRLELDARGAY